MTPDWMVDRTLKFAAVWDAWKDGPLPRIEAQLGGVSGPDRDELLRLLLKIDARRRQRMGMHPAAILRDYLDRLPDDAEVIRSALTGALSRGPSPHRGPARSLPKRSPAPRDDPAERTFQTADPPAAAELDLWNELNMAIRLVVIIMIEVAVALLGVWWTSGGFNLLGRDIADDSPVLLWGPAWFAQILGLIGLVAQFALLVTVPVALLITGWRLVALLAQSGGYRAMEERFSLLGFLLGLGALLGILGVLPTILTGWEPPDRTRPSAPAGP